MTKQNKINYFASWIDRRRVQFSTFHLLKQLEHFFFSVFYYCSFFLLFALKQVEHTSHGASHNPLFAHSLLLSLGHATFHSKLCLHFKVSSLGFHHLFYCLVVSFHFISSSFSFCICHSLLCVLSVHFILSCHISSLDEALQFSTNVVFFIWFHHCYFSLLFFSCSDLTMHSSLIPSYIIF